MARRYPSRQTRRYAERHQYGGGGGNTTPHRFDWTIVAKIASAGGTTLVVALAFGSFSPAGLLDMATAYGMLIAAWVIGVLVIVFSEMVWNFPIKHRIIAGIIASLILGGLLFALGRYEHFKNFELTHITPADLPTPPTTCEINDDELVDRLQHSFPASDFFDDRVGIASPDEGLQFRFADLLARRNPMSAPIH